MKIIKHGSIYRASCRQCGCEFTISHKEAQELMQDVRKKPGFYAVECPECGSWTHFEKVPIGGSES